jgi:hypothetical protein
MVATKAIQRFRNAPSARGPNKPYMLLGWTLAPFLPPYLISWGCPFRAFLALALSGYGCVCRHSSHNGSLGQKRNPFLETVSAGSMAGYDSGKGFQFRGYRVEPLGP